MGKIVKEGLTFDDVLLIPQYSEVVPSETELNTEMTENIKLNIPIIASPMDTVCESEMAIAMAQLGGIGIIHKNLPIEAQCEEVNIVKAVTDFDEQAAVNKDGKLYVGASVSVGSDFEERITALANTDVDVIIIDSAHGHSKNIIDAVKYAKENFKDVDIIAGNIATKEAAQDLVKAGVDGIRAGIGPGSICTTRVVAGVGVPQLTAIMDVMEGVEGTNVKVIADGGLKTSGDITKALATGAHTVMLGSMLSGTAETPGDIIEIEGKTYKTYVGMGSLAAMKRGSSERYFQKSDKPGKLVPEGIESYVTYKGEVKDVIYQIIGGLRSGMGYNGAPTLQDLANKSQFVRITNSGLAESHPHSLSIMKSAPNYNGRG